MLFNSLEFFLFLFAIFIFYWRLFSKKLIYQNLFLLAASYFFYSFWDWRFLTLIIASTAVDYYSGLYIHRSASERRKKFWLGISVFFNVGMLLFFKYFNFFIESWVDFFKLLDINVTSNWNLNIILPVGISFYTFQTMSYSFDVYRKKVDPVTNFISFATYIAFFPQLVAGPIEKASNLLPQITGKRTFSYQQSTEGFKLILWGLFKKVAIADALAPIVDDIFTNYTEFSASTLALGAFFFSFQMYGDFSGYSDMAIGTSKLLGIELISNFKFPNFSRNVIEHWQRWHISLSSWFKEYLYFPLGGSRGSTQKTVRNIYIIFLVSGLWHGANWTFVFWGALHATFYSISLFFLGQSKNPKKIVAYHTILSSLKEALQIMLTFSLITFARVFFRSGSISEAFGFIKQFFLNFKFEIYHHPNGYRLIDYLLLIITFIGYEFLIRKDERSPYPFTSKYVRFFAYFITIFTLLLFFDDHSDRSFIYFQF